MRAFNTFKSVYCSLCSKTWQTIYIGKIIIRSIHNGYKIQMKRKYIFIDINLYIRSTRSFRLFSTKPFTVWTNWWSLPNR